jgi:hypothetical protein
MTRLRTRHTFAGRPVQITEAQTARTIELATTPCQLRLTKLSGVCAATCQILLDCSFTHHASADIGLNSMPCGGSLLMSPCCPSFWLSMNKKVAMSHPGSAVPMAQLHDVSLLPCAAQT